MITIKVDAEVYGVLKMRAEPFVDAPNDVLRRILGLAGRDNGHAGRQGSRGRESSGAKSSETSSTGAFLARVLDSEFGGQFRVRPPYRTMFESPGAVVYFQNFNSPGTSNLWYRLRKTALDHLLAAKEKAVVAFSNPAESTVYFIPADEIKRRADRSGWDRNDLEVNIDPGSHRWRELDWDLSPYFKRIGDTGDRHAG